MKVPTNCKINVCTAVFTEFTKRIGPWKFCMHDSFIINKINVGM